MKRLLLILIILIMNATIIHHPAKAQAGIAQIIAEGIKKVIKAVDLKIQRLQNETIWLQNAQKTIENTISKLRLDEISDWVERQRVLYRDYFEELAKVKAVIAYYHRIKDITNKQVRLVAEYRRAWDLFRQDDHFSEEEIIYMGKVYPGILDKSLENLDQLFMVISSFATTMSDAKRMEIINQAGDKIDRNYADMKTFNRQNIVLSLQRAKDLQEVAILKSLYGIE